MPVNKVILSGTLFLVILSASAGKTMDSKNAIRNELKSSNLGIILQPYSGSRSESELSPGPDVLFEGLQKMLDELSITPDAKEVIKGALAGLRSR